MSDSKALPESQLPQIRPVSNNTIDTEKSLNLKNGRK
jgi:hypothetical protein